MCRHCGGARAGSVSQASVQEGKQQWQATEEIVICVCDVDLCFFKFGIVSPGGFAANCVFEAVSISALLMIN